MCCVICGQERVNKVRYCVVSSVGRKGLTRSDIVCVIWGQGRVNKVRYRVVSSGGREGLIRSDSVLCHLEAKG